MCFPTSIGGRVSRSHRCVPAADEVASGAREEEEEEEETISSNGAEPAEKRSIVSNELPNPSASNHPSCGGGDAGLVRDDGLGQLAHPLLATTAAAVPALESTTSATTSPCECQSSSQPSKRTEEEETSTTPTSAESCKKSKRKAARRSGGGATPKRRMQRHYVLHDYHDHAQDSLGDYGGMYSGAGQNHNHSSSSSSVSTNNNNCDNCGACKQGGVVLRDRKNRRGPRGGVMEPFPVKLHRMLDRIEEDGRSDVISWMPHGRCFVVHKPHEFVESLMIRYFNQHKLTSFQRQLNLYGFNRLTSGPDKGGYYHELFLRGMPALCERMVRIRIKGTGIKGASSPETEPDFYAMPFVGVREAGAARHRCRAKDEMSPPSPSRTPSPPPLPSSSATPTCTNTTLPSRETSKTSSKSSDDYKALITPDSQTESTTSGVSGSLSTMASYAAATGNGKRSSGRTASKRKLGRADDAASPSSPVPAPPLWRKGASAFEPPHQVTSSAPSRPSVVPRAVIVPSSPDHRQETPPPSPDKKKTTRKKEPFPIQSLTLDSPRQRLVSDQTTIASVVSSFPSVIQPLPYQAYSTAYSSSNKNEDAARSYFREGHSIASSGTPNVIPQDPRDADPSNRRCTPAPWKRREPPMPASSITCMGRPAIKEEDDALEDIEPLPFRYEGDGVDARGGGDDDVHSEDSVSFEGKHFHYLDSFVVDKSHQLGESYDAGCVPPQILSSPAAAAGAALDQDTMPSYEGMKLTIEQSSSPGEKRGRISPCCRPEDTCTKDRKVAARRPSNSPTADDAEQPASPESGGGSKQDRLLFESSNQVIPKEFFDCIGLSLDTDGMDLSIKDDAELGYLLEGIMK